MNQLRIGKGIKNSSFAQLVYLIILNLVVTADLGLDAPLIVRIVDKYGESDFNFTIFVIIPFTVFNGVFALLWGYLSDKYERKKILLLNLFSGAFCILGVSVVFYYHLPFFFAGLFRVLSAACLAGIIPVSMSMVVDLIEEEKRGGIFGWLGISGTLGTGLGFLLSGSLVQYGLHTPYLAGALLALGFFVLGSRMKEPSRAAGEEMLRELIQTGQLDYTHRIELSALKEIFSKMINIVLFISVILFTMPASALGVFFITFLIRNHNFNEFFATIYLLVVFSSELLGQIVFGRIGDRWYKRSLRGRIWASILALGLALPFLLVAFWIDFEPEKLWSLLLFSGLILVGGFFMVGANPLSLTSFCDVNLPEHRGTVLALSNIAWLLARIFATPLCSYLADQWNDDYGKSFQAIMLFFIPASLFLIPVALLIPKVIKQKQFLLKERFKEQVE